MSTSNISYRPDIDGLRAVAVLLVILYHAGFAIPGGYVGVDVFFVISGYLITGIIAKEVAEQRFSFKTFYLRRFKRLLPAFLVVAVGTTLLIRSYYLPDDFEGFSKSLRYALVGISNFYFLNETQGYFASDAELLPIIHTWSLSVEEQFYIIWPLLITVLFRFSHTIHLQILLPIFFLALLGLSEWMARNSPHAAYYMLPARAFELMMGGLLALDRRKVRTLTTTINHGVSLLGLVLIIGSALMLDKTHYFPGLNAFWPCLGAVLLIWSGSATIPGCVNQWLSKPLPVGLGLISYSVYLWHWPPIALAHYLNIELSLGVATSLIVLSIILGWLTWKFVEQPFRFRIKWHFKTAFLLLLILPFAVFLGFNKFLRETHGNPIRLSKELYVLAERISQDAAHEVFKKCHTKDTIIEKASNCLFGDLSPNTLNPDFLLLGDSHANSAHGFFETLANNVNLVGLEITASSSPFLINTEQYDIKNDQFILRPNYKGRIDAIQAYIEKGFNGFFVLAASWTGYVVDEKFKFAPVFNSALSNTLAYLSNFDVPIFIYLAVPYLPDNVSPRCDAAALLDMPLVNSGINCAEQSQDYAVSQFQDQQRTVTKIMDEMAVKFPNLVFIDPKDIICKEGRCVTELDQFTIYRDKGHLNYSGSKVVGEHYLKKFGNPLKNAESQVEISDIWR